MATNYRTVARKLQTALAMSGRKISINQYQAYSARAGRTVTKYVLSEYVLSEYVQHTPGEKGKYQNLFESWSLPDVVKYLANLYSEVSNHGT